jgi:5'-phosphate synthase pdxT subunit
MLAESTTIALLARLSGLMDPLKKFVSERPVWGTCAGAILLSQTVENTKKGGQEVLGGMSIGIARNGWGSQVRFTVDHRMFHPNSGLDRILRGEPHG